MHALLETLAAVTAIPDELRAGVIPPTEEEIRSWQELDPGAVVLAEAGALVPWTRTRPTTSTSARLPVPPWT